MMKELQFPFKHQLTNSLTRPFIMPQHYRTRLGTGPQPPTNYSLGNKNKMERILILGSSGSGKSTFARVLGPILELPVIHLDRHYWKPGWVGTPEAEWQQIVHHLTQRERWIIDGNYRTTLDMRLQVADTVIFLDLPPWLCAMRAMKRRFQYRNGQRPDMARGCRERILDPQFPQFIRHIFEYPNRARADVKSRLNQQLEQKNVIWLRSTKEVENFLKNPWEQKIGQPHFNPISTNGAFPQQTPLISQD